MRKSLPKFMADATAPGDKDTASQITSPDSANEISEPLEPLLECRDLCRVFNRSDRTIRRWVRAKYIVPVRIGNSEFFVPDDIRALIKKRLRR